MYLGAIEELIEKFELLPGIGHKSAERIAFYLLENMTEEETERMAATIVNTKRKIRLCECCLNLTDESPCKI